VAIAGVLAMRRAISHWMNRLLFLDPIAAKRVLDIVDKLHLRAWDNSYYSQHGGSGAPQRIVVMNGVALLSGRQSSRNFRGKSGMLQKIGMQLPQITELLLSSKNRACRATDIVSLEEALEQSVP